MEFKKYKLFFIYLLSLSINFEITSRFQGGCRVAGSSVHLFPAPDQTCSSVQIIQLEQPSEVYSWSEILWAESREGTEEDTEGEPPCPWEYGVSAPSRDPQSRATKNRRGAPVALASENHWWLGSPGRLRQHHPRQKVMALLLHQPEKFSLTCVCGRGYTVELRAGGRVWLVHPAVNLRDPLFSGRTFGREQDRCGLGKRISPAHLKHRGGLSSSTCGTACSAPHCWDMRQGRMALGWNSVPMQLIGQHGDSET